MIPLALLFGLSLFIAGSDLLAVQVIQAKQLGMPVPQFVGALPLSCVVGYALAVFALRRIKRESIRWVAFAATTVLAYVPLVMGADFLQRQTVSIPLSAPLTQESSRKLEEVYQVKWSGFSKAIRVRREDYSAAMAEFVQKLVAAQGKVP